MSQTRAQLVQGFSNTSASADVITVDSSANVGINKTSPVKDLDVTGEIRASTGILFGTDTAAANTLDDYEEGTWTPTLSGQTVSNLDSRYRKIGSVVTLYTDFNVTSLSNIASGDRLTGFGGYPFTVASGSNLAGHGGTTGGSAGGQRWYLLTRGNTIKCVSTNGGNMVKVSLVISYTTV